MYYFFYLCGHKTGFYLERLCRASDSRNLGILWHLSRPPTSLLALELWISVSQGEVFHKEFREMLLLHPPALISTSPELSHVWCWLQGHLVWQTIQSGCEVAEEELQSANTKWMRPWRSLEGKKKRNTVMFLTHDLRLLKTMNKFLQNNWSCITRRLALCLVFYWKILQITRSYK